MADVLFSASASRTALLAQIGHTYNVKQFGALGDGKEVFDAAITAGASRTLTSASSPFVASDAGKSIAIYGAGAGGIPLLTTIASYTNPSTVQVGANAGTTVSGARAYWGTDDTNALVACASALCTNKRGVMYFPAGIYIMSLGSLSNLTTSQQAGITEVGSNSGSAIGIAFVGARGIKICGEGAVIKRKPNGSTTTTSQQRMGWGMMNFKDCQDVEITGITFDGERDCQRTFANQPGGSSNHGVHVWGDDCDRFWIHHCKFIRQGVILDSTDFQGDGVYFKNGSSDIRIHNNHFEDYGRWAVTLERDYPILETQIQKGFYVHDNTFVHGFSEDGSVQLGSIDIEPWQAYDHIHIHRNHFRGSNKISCGSEPLDTNPVHTVAGLSVCDNVWDYRGAIATDTDILVVLGGDWGDIVPGVSVSKNRTFLGARIERNTLYSNQELGHFVQLHEATFDGLSICDNMHLSEKSGTLLSSAFIITNAVCFQGVIRFSRNYIRYKGEIFNIDSWQNNFNGIPFRLFIEDNIIDECSWGMRFIAPAAGESAGGDITWINRNKFLDQNTRSSITGTGSTVYMGDGNLFIESGSGANIFTGVQTLGRGSAQISAGGTSVVVTHGLTETPYFVDITPVSDPRRATSTDFQTWWVSAIGATTFQINTHAAVNSATTFHWQAKSHHTS